MISQDRNFDQQCEYIDFNGSKLLWPKHDTKLKQVNDWVADVNHALLYMARNGYQQRVAIQAGGACGVWPLELAQHFEITYTYEPDPLNYWCLAQNCAGYAQEIAHYNMALGERRGNVRTVLPPSEQGNCGAFYTVDADEKVPHVPMVKLDDQPLFNVDLICLDMEGREVEALRGAQQLINKFKPVIMIEEKPLPQMGAGKDVPHEAGAATEWLEKMHKYKVVDRVHRDVILAPTE